MRGLRHTQGVGPLPTLGNFSSSNKTSSFLTWYYQVLSDTKSDSINDRVTHESDKGKRGVCGRVSGRFGAGRGYPMLPDGWYSVPRHRGDRLTWQKDCSRDFTVGRPHTTNTAPLSVSLSFTFFSSLQKAPKSLRGLKRAPWGLETLPFGGSGTVCNHIHMGQYISARYP